MSLIHTLKFITRHPLNRSRKLSAMMRFAKWQIGSRLVPGAVVFDWVNGARFLVKPGEAGLTGNIYTGLHEFAEMGFLLHFLRPEDLFVDIGANVGSFTILAAAAIGARGVAFEPVPGTYRRLVENMRLNHLDEKVRCINKGVGAEKGAIAFTSDGDTTNHAIASGEKCENKIMVDVTTLDAALENEVPSLMKIDVEGFETPVLNGARDTLKNQALHAVIMELNGSGARYGFDESVIIDSMLKLGFGMYAYDPLSRSLSDLNGKDVNSVNTIFIRNKGFVESRLKSAPKLTVFGRQF